MSNYAPAVDWAIRLIEILAGSDDALGITDLSRLAGINKNMVYRALNSLEAAGWVFCENPSEKKYRLTLRPFHMARKAADRLSICPVAEPYLHALWKRHGESTYLGILREGRVLYIRHYDSIQDVKVAGTLGGSYELYCSAPGKILLAYMPEDALAAYLAHPRKKRTEHTITEYDVLMAELEKIRTDGYAVDNEEYGRGILCLAAPVFDGSGAVAAAVGCSVSTIETTVETMCGRLRADILDTAAKISTCLGYVKP